MPAVPGRRSSASGSTGSRRPHSDRPARTNIRLHGTRSAIIRKLKEKPIDDALFGPVVVRADGRAIHNMYILKAKDPKASKGKWDILENIGVLSGPEAFRPMDQGGCTMAEQAKSN